MLYALAAMFIWSTTSVQIRFINLDSYSICFWTNVIVFTAVTLILLKDWKKNLCQFLKNKYILCAVGITALINGITYYEAIKLTTIANALITHYTAPVIVALLSPFILGEKFTKKTFTAFIMSVVGLLLIIDWSELRFENNDFKGIIFGLISAVGYAAVIIIGRKYKTGIKSFIYIYAQSITAIVFLFWKADMNIGALDSVSLILVFVFAFINVLVAAHFFFFSLTKTSANNVAILGYIEPVGAILISILFLNEKLNGKIIAGGFMILLSAGIVSINIKKKN